MFTTQKTFIKIGANWQPPNDLNKYSRKGLELLGTTEEGPSPPLRLREDALLGNGAFSILGDLWFPGSLIGIFRVCFVCMHACLYTYA